MIYVPSPDGDSIVDGINCRKIKKLQMFSAITFDIEPTSSEFFIVLESNSENPITFRYSVPDWQSDFICVRAKLDKEKNINIFFNSAKSSTVKISSMSRKKRILLIILAFVLCQAFLIGMAFLGDFIHSGFAMSKDPRVFQTGDISITLNKSFRAKYEEGFYAWYEAKNCYVGIIKEDFESNPILRYTKPDQYCEMLMEYNAISEWETVSADGLIYVVFEDGVEDSYIYRVYAYKTNDAYWTVQISCPDEKYGEWSKYYDEWAKTVKIK